jgi:hypothetical protein
MSTSYPILPIPGGSGGEFLEYAIYPLNTDTNLNNILDYTLDLASTLTDSYIWNLDSFALTLDPSTPKLHGRMDLGEDSGVSVDEWLVVSFLWTVSKRFKDVVIRYIPPHVIHNSIQDSDGEFLLIESALHIPNWLKPETAENRVHDP